MAGLLALFIPILALSIPIVAIISGGPIGKALAERINTRNAGGSAAGGERVAMLERRIEQLERLARTQAEELDRLSQDYSFVTRLLEDGGKKSS
jgi:ABC-type microcin C transport system permease subunit YejB